MDTNKLFIVQWFCLCMACWKVNQFIIKYELTCVTWLGESNTKWIDCEKKKPKAHLGLKLSTLNGSHISNPTLIWSLFLHNGRTVIPSNTVTKWSIGTNERICSSCIINAQILWLKFLNFKSPRWIGIWMATNKLMWRHCWQVENVSGVWSQLAFLLVKQILTSYSFKHLNWAMMLKNI